VTEPDSYEYWYKQQYFRIGRFGRAYVWRVNEWIRTTIGVSEIRGGREMDSDSLRSERNKRYRDKQKKLTGKKGN
jgi:hypothetical protein